MYSGTVCCLFFLETPTERWDFGRFLGEYENSETSEISEIMKISEMFSKISEFSEVSEFSF